MDRSSISSIERIPNPNSRSVSSSSSQRQVSTTPPASPPRVLPTASNLGSGSGSQPFVFGSGGGGGGGLKSASSSKPNWDSNPNPNHRNSSTHHHHHHYHHHRPTGSTSSSVGGAGARFLLPTTTVPPISFTPSPSSSPPSHSHSHPKSSSSSSSSSHSSRSHSPSPSPPNNNLRSPTRLHHRIPQPDWEPEVSPEPEMVWKQLGGKQFLGRGFGRGEEDGEGGDDGDLDYREDDGDLDYREDDGDLDYREDDGDLDLDEQMNMEVEEADFEFEPGPPAKRIMISEDEEEEEGVYDDHDDDQEEEDEEQEEEEEEEDIIDAEFDNEVGWVRNQNGSSSRRGRGRTLSPLESPSMSPSLSPSPQPSPPPRRVIMPLPSSSMNVAPMGIGNSPANAASAGGAGGGRRMVPPPAAPESEFSLEYHNEEEDDDEMMVGNDQDHHDVVSPSPSPSPSPQPSPPPRKVIPLPSIPVGSVKSKRSSALSGGRGVESSTSRSREREEAPSPSPSAMERDYSPPPRWVGGSGSGSTSVSRGGMGTSTNTGVTPRRHDHGVLPDESQSQPTGIQFLGAPFGNLKVTPIKNNRNNGNGNGKEKEKETPTMTASTPGGSSSKSRSRSRKGSKKASLLSVRSKSSAIVMKDSPASVSGGGGSGRKGKLKKRSWASSSRSVGRSLREREREKEKNGGSPMKMIGSIGRKNKGKGGLFLRKGTGGGEGSKDMKTTNGEANPTTTGNFLSTTPADGSGQTISRSTSVRSKNSARSGGPSSSTTSYSHSRSHSRPRPPPPPHPTATSTASSSNLSVSAYGPSSPSSSRSPSHHRRYQPGGRGTSPGPRLGMTPSPSPHRGGLTPSPSPARGGHHRTGHLSPRPNRNLTLSLCLPEPEDEDLVLISHEDDGFVNGDEDDDDGYGQGNLYREPIAEEDAEAENEETMMMMYAGRGRGMGDARMGRGAGMGGRRGRNLADPSALQQQQHPRQGIGVGGGGFGAGGGLVDVSPSPARSESSYQSRYRDVMQKDYEAEEMERRLRGEYNGGSGYVDEDEDEKMEEGEEEREELAFARDSPPVTPAVRHVSIPATSSTGSSLAEARRFGTTTTTTTPTSNYDINNSNSARSSSSIARSVPITTATSLSPSPVPSPSPSFEGSRRSYSPAPSVPLSKAEHKVWADQYEEAIRQQQIRHQERQKQLLVEQEREQQQQRYGQKNEKLRSVYDESLMKDGLQQRPPSAASFSNPNLYPNTTNTSFKTRLNNNNKIFNPPPSAWSNSSHSNSNSNSSARSIPIHEQKQQQQRNGFVFHKNHSNRSTDRGSSAGSGSAVGEFGASASAAGSGSRSGSGSGSAGSASGSGSGSGSGYYYSNSRLGIDSGFLGSGSDPGKMGERSNYHGSDVGMEYDEEIPDSEQEVLEEDEDTPDANEHGKDEEHPFAREESPPPMRSQNDLPFARDSSPPPKKSLFSGGGFGKGKGRKKSGEKLKEKEKESQPAGALKLFGLKKKKKSKEMARENEKDKGKGKAKEIVSEAEQPDYHRHPQVPLAAPVPRAPAPLRKVLDSPPLTPGAEQIITVPFHARTHSQTSHHSGARSFSRPQSALSGRSSLRPDSRAQSSRSRSHSQTSSRSSQSQAGFRPSSRGGRITPTASPSPGIGLSAPQPHHYPQSPGTPMSHYHQNRAPSRPISRMSMMSRGSFTRTRSPVFSEFDEYEQHEPSRPTSRMSLRSMVSQTFKKPVLNRISSVLSFRSSSSRKSSERSRSTSRSSSRFGDADEENQTYHAHGQYDEHGVFSDDYGDDEDESDLEADEAETRKYFRGLRKVRQKQQRKWRWDKGLQELGMRIAPKPSLPSMKAPPPRPPSASSGHRVLHRSRAGSVVSSHRNVPHSRPVSALSGRSSQIQRPGSTMSVYSSTSHQPVTTGILAHSPQVKGGRSDGPGGGIRRTRSITFDDEVRAQMRERRTPTPSVVVPPVRPATSLAVRHEPEREATQERPGSSLSFYKRDTLQNPGAKPMEFSPYSSPSPEPGPPNVSRPETSLSLYAVGKLSAEESTRTGNLTPRSLTPGSRAISPDDRPITPSVSDSPRQQKTSNPAARPGSSLSYSVSPYARPETSMSGYDGPGSGESNVDDRDHLAPRRLDFRPDSALSSEYDRRSVPVSPDRERFIDNFPKTQIGGDDEDEYERNGTEDGYDTQQEFDIEDEIERTLVRDGGDMTMTLSRNLDFESSPEPEDDDDATPSPEERTPEPEERTPEPDDFTPQASPEPEDSQAHSNPPTFLMRGERPGTPGSAMFKSKRSAPASPKSLTPSPEVSPSPPGSPEQRLGAISRFGMREMLGMDDGYDPTDDEERNPSTFKSYLDPPSPTPPPRMSRSPRRAAPMLGFETDDDETGDLREVLGGSSGGLGPFQLNIIGATPSPTMHSVVNDPMNAQGLLAPSRPSTGGVVRRDFAKDSKARQASPENEDNASQIPAAPRVRQNAISKLQAQWEARAKGEVSKQSRGSDSTSSSRGKAKKRILHVATQSVSTLKEFWNNTTNSVHEDGEPYSRPQSRATESTASSDHRSSTLSPTSLASETLTEDPILASAMRGMLDKRRERFESDQEAERLKQAELAQHPKTLRKRSSQFSRKSEDKQPPRSHSRASSGRSVSEGTGMSIVDPSRSRHSSRRDFSGRSADHASKHSESVILSRHPSLLQRLALGQGLPPQSTHAGRSRRSVDSSADSGSTSNNTSSVAPPSIWASSQNHGRSGGRMTRGTSMTTAGTIETPATTPGGSPVQSPEYGGFEGEDVEVNLERLGDGTKKRNSSGFSVISGLLAPNSHSPETTLHRRVSGSSKWSGRQYHYDEAPTHSTDGANDHKNPDEWSTSGEGPWMFPVNAPVNSDRQTRRSLPNQSSREGRGFGAMTKEDQRTQPRMSLGSALPVPSFNMGSRGNDDTWNANPAIPGRGAQGSRRRWKRVTSTNTIDREPSAASNRPQSMAYYP